MQILKRTLVAALATSLAAAPAFAQAVTKDASTASAKAPDFNGSWEMNASKSDFGPMAAQAPTKVTMTVTQSGASLKFAQAMSTPMGDQTVNQEFTLDGQERPVAGAGGQPALSTAKVEGDAIVIKSKMQIQGMDITQDSRWTLAPDGKSMTVDRQVATPQGNLTMKLVFDKK